MKHARSSGEIADSRRVSIQVWCIIIAFGLMTHPRETRVSGLPPRSHRDRNLPMVAISSGATRRFESPGTQAQRHDTLSSAPVLRGERGEKLGESTLSSFLRGPLRWIPIAAQLDAHWHAPPLDFPSPGAAAIVAHDYDMIISPKQDHAAPGFWSCRRAVPATTGQAWAVIGETGTINAAGRWPWRHRRSLQPAHPSRRNRRSGTDMPRGLHSATETRRSPRAC